MRIDTFQGLERTDPLLDAGMRGYIIKTVSREYWRVANLYEFDDLVMEGYLCYCKCKKAAMNATLASGGPAYPASGVPTKAQRRNFQVLFSTAFANHISSLSAKQKGGSEYPMSQLIGDDSSAEEFADQHLVPQPELGTFMALLANAPAELKQLIQILALDGQDLFVFKRRRNKRRHIRETSNEFYCRILGLDPKEVDIAGKLKAYFGS